MKEKYFQNILIISLVALISIPGVFFFKSAHKQEITKNTTTKTITVKTETTTTESTTTTTTTAKVITTKTTTKKTTTSNSSDILLYKPYHVEPADSYSIEGISYGDIKTIFKNKNAYVIGDSMVEGLTAYNVLDEDQAVFHRGRRIDNMEKDLPKLSNQNPSYLFLSYGSNDLELWTGRVNSFISAYRKKLNYLKEALPNTIIIINSILPASQKAVNKSSAFSYQELFNNELKNLANELNVPFLENSVYLNEREKPYSSDGIHPKAFYFTLWGKHMVSYLNSN